MSIGAHLQDIGLHPPAILSTDRAAGFLLLEDLGDDLFARVMTRDATSEIALYRAAIDVLSIVQKVPAPDLPAFDSAVMAQIAGLAASAYAGRSQETDVVTEALHPLLDRIAEDAPVMVEHISHISNDKDTNSTDADANQSYVVLAIYLSVQNSIQIHVCRI